MEKEFLDSEHRTLEERAGFWGKVSFNWVTPILEKGYEEPLQQKHIPRIHRRFGARVVAARWEAMWARERQKPRPSIVRALIRGFIWRFQFSVAMELIGLILRFFSPILMQAMLTYTQTTNRDPNQGLAFVLIMFVSNMFRVVSHMQTGVVLGGIGLDVQTAMVTSIYNKAIRSSTRGKYSKGEIINIQSSDAIRLANTAMSINTLWTTPANLIIAIVLLLRVIGIASVSGMTIMIITMPFNSVVYWALASLRIELMQLSDRRITSMNEMLSGIRVVKFTCLEEHFKNRILTVRRQEQTLLKRQAYWNSMASVVMFIIPIMISVSTFVTYAAMGFILTPAIIFTSVSLFSGLRAPLGALPMLVTRLAEAKAAVRRVEKYLLLPEFITDKEPEGTLGSRVVVIKDGSFRWGEEGKVVLKNINLEVNRGELLVVIGKVGSGKSSLIGAMLGEMEKVSGRMFVTGKVAYSQQQAWIVNDTVENNILFGSVKFRSEYDRTIQVCALERDLRLLPAGDKTEIGEAGVNLSGGQKQRLSLARAVYYNGDVVLLDDPLSAVDAHVGKHIFDTCINGVLKTKTRVLVTHQLQYLQYADKVAVMSDGQIAFCGSYRELMTSTLNVSDFIKEAQGTEVPEEPAELAPGDNDNEDGDDDSDAEGEAKEANDAAAGEAKLVEDEDRNIGAVTLSTIWWYLQKCGEVGLFYFIFLIFSEFTRISTDLWLSYWSDQKFWPDPGVSFYLAVYIMMGFISGLFSLLKGLSLVEASFHASVRIHAEMLSNILRAPLWFFDTNPGGRILNRFARDLMVMDGGIAERLAGVVGLVSVTCGTITVILFVQPFIILAFIPLTSIYYVLMQYYRATSRELNRIVSVCASPIYSHFTESLNGVMTIRSYRMVDKFIEENYRNLDEFHGPYWIALQVGRWLSIRLEFIGSLVLLATSSMVITNTSLPPGLVGLTLNYSGQITMVLEMAVTTVSTVERSMNSVERVLAYCKKMPLEAPLIIPERRPAFTWMSQQAPVSVHHLTLRYRPGLPEVLRDVTFSVRSNEKVGVVGRTGSGKSTTMLALMRMIEPDSGQIFIDGIDISTIGLVDLRSRISIIPQDPVLFAGTLRQNLDPDAQHPDKRIWEAIDQAHLRDNVEATDEKLDVRVMEGGSNFSVGQRQLVCLARALLRNSRLLLMDEVTASVDIETDNLIQKTVAKAFTDCTIITIAHRLDTIMPYDKVMVMSDGRVVEYDAPLALLARSNGHFRAMVDNTGDRARALEEIAKKAAMARRQHQQQASQQTAAAGQ